MSYMLVSQIACKINASDVPVLVIESTRMTGNKVNVPLPTGEDVGKKPELFLLVMSERPFALLNNGDGKRAIAHETEGEALIETLRTLFMCRRKVK